MSSAWSRPLRALATQTAVITMIGLGLAAPAAAAPGDPGSGNENDKATSAKAEASEKKTTRSQSDTSTSDRSTSSSANDPADHKTSGTAGTRGTPPSPQPLSGADQNEGGANGECPGGPYCGTERYESQNGKGDGEAKGKPCAGCVGAADNKNPKGQYPDGDTDGNMKNGKGNAGYECDRNQGVGQGNPAHTGCEGETPTTTTETCPDGSAMPASGDVKDCDKGAKTCPDGSPLPASGDMKDCDTTTPPGGGGGFVPPGIGGVDIEVPTTTPPTVTRPVVAGVEMLVPPAGVELYRPPAEVPQAAPQAPQALPGAAVLPATGASSLMTLLSALAFGLLTLGAGTLMYRRATHG